MTFNSTKASILAGIVVAILAAAPARAGDFTADQLKAALKKHPEVLIDAITDNRKAIIDILNKTWAEEQARRQKDAADAEARAYEDSFKHPFKPAIDANTLILGNKNAKYTLVEYADFQCPYCAAAVPTIAELRRRHGDDLRFIYKLTPLPFHPEAMPAAQWFEAIAMQSPEKAWQFHDILFQNQDKLGADFYRKTAKGLGIDVAKCEQDVGSQAVRDRIAADISEATNIGFEGTPGFLLNGIPVKGAYPVDYFEDVIKKLDTTKTVSQLQ